MAALAAACVLLATASLVSAQGNLAYSVGGNFPSTYTGSSIRFIAIGDWGWQGEKASIGAAVVSATVDQCTAANFSTSLPGFFEQSEQRTTAVFMDEVCNYAGGCQFVVGTGDNFYQCGVDDTDSQHRFQNDWIAVYKNYQKTPSIAPLTWYNTIGNHDIAGSITAQINYGNINPEWQMPDTNYARDWTINGVTVRGIFYDMNPMISKYNTNGNKYNTQYYKSHHNASYINQTVAFMEAAMRKSPAPTYSFIVGHYPMFGSATEFALLNGEFNGHAMVLDVINRLKPTAYFNGHDHVLTLKTGANIANQSAPFPTAFTPYGPYTNNYTMYVTTGAGGLSSQADTCGGTVSYTNGGFGGFVMVSANATSFSVDFFSSGSLNTQCTITATPDKSVPPVVGTNCVANTKIASCCATGCAN